jgi:hypothetical protein
VVQKRDGEDQLGQSVKNKEALCIVKKKRNIIHTRKRRKDDWIGHILRRNYLLIQEDRGKDRSDGKTRKKT